MNLLWAQVDERGVILFTMGEIFPNIIDIPWNMWDAILPHIAKQREEMEADIAAGKDVPPAPLRIPSKDEISLKDFFR
jgi:hypothetical protein